MHEAHFRVPYNRFMKLAQDARDASTLRTIRVDVAGVTLTQRVGDQHTWLGTFFSEVFDAKCRTGIRYGGSVYDPRHPVTCDPVDVWLGFENVGDAVLFKLVEA